MEEVFVHGAALCESDDVGAGTRVWAFAHVMKGARVGRDCNVGGGAFIEAGAVVGDRVTIKNHVLLWDKVVIEDDVFLGPNAVFTNDFVPRSAPEFKNPAEKFLTTVVRRGASIGANATVVCGVEVGEGALVGAGTVVIADVPARAVVVGNPARQIGWICDCGTRLPDPPEAGGAGELACPACGRVYALATEPGAGLELVRP